MLNWANQFNIFCFLDNNEYDFETPTFECLLAVGCKQTICFSETSDVEKLQAFYAKKPTWFFGHLGYNAFENAYTKNEETDFGNGFFFEPEIVLKLTNGKIEILQTSIDENIIKYEIENTIVNIKIEKNEELKILPHITKEEYIHKIKQLQQHILRGDCYEINFCQKFEAKNTTLNPIQKYLELIALSPAPFGSLYKLNNAFCLCASPERFLQKKGNKLISQPIKGTTRRNANATIDTENKNHLLQSQKEKSENVMVVDIVRNDMSMVCEKGSVKVKELFGIYSFPQVHQMISTIEGTVAADLPFTKIIESCYPMGSMTGAPKKRVMELIEQYEENQRGLFSGSIGYITPNADFDFNVVIRSIFYNETKKEVSFFAGSGITFYSNAEEEYDECIAKAEALMKVLIS
ncbi:MAG: anthranilate synthase component I family protein [Ferruginibacter sp.]